ncbi:MULTISPECIES: hypothetical protein [Sorangium]|uniref:hypothetical protein n=1 Tax=Sorangium TaxID=39643 RepID=UPI003D9C4C5E
MRYFSLFLLLVIVALVAVMIYERRLASQEMADLRKELSLELTTLKADQERRAAERTVQPVLERAFDRAGPVEDQGSPLEGSEPQRAASVASTEPVTPEEAAAKHDLAFEAEQVDRGWAPEAVRQVRGGIEAILPSGALRSVECRRTLCKAEIVCADSDEVATFFEQGFRRQDRFWRGAATVLKTGETADGKWTMAAFFAREGSMLSRL